MISVEEALAQLFALVRGTGIETVPLVAAAGRVLAEPVQAARDQPPFAASAMDGYAVRDADIRPGAVLRVIGESAAGHRWTGTLAAGQAVRISTGAPVPDGADRVVIQEDTSRSGDRLTISDTPGSGGNIRPAGGDFTRGAALGAPRRITPARLSLLASMNIPRVPVRCRPRVALLSTGDELVMPGEVPSPDQIPASNGFALKALLEEAGAQCQMLPIARDTEASLRATLDLAAGADLIVTIGGASVGDHDLVLAVLAAMGMEQSFYKVAMRPGKPLMAGRLDGTMVVGLPGNPVSTVVCGHVFLIPVIRAMLGLGQAPAPRLRAALAAPLDANGPRAHYMRARLGPGGLQAMPRQDSSLMSVLADADALLIRPPHDPARPVGDEVAYIPI